MSPVTATAPVAVTDRIAELLASFKLPTLGKELVPRFLAAGKLEELALLLDVLELEAGDRQERRVDRLRRASLLPPGKTLDTLNQARLPLPLMHQVHQLAKGAFLDRATNVLAFGRPGTGKSHVACALGHALVEAGYSVYFTPTYLLVQQLLVAKRALDLPRALRKLDAFDLLILDDIGYVQQAADEVEVLFTLMAERYERRSLLITSNLSFGDWGRIFKDPMTTAAAIDRLVHHSVLLEFPGTSYRADEALAARDKGEQAEATTTTTERPAGGRRRRGR